MSAEFRKTSKVQVQQNGKSLMVPTTDLEWSELIGPEDIRLADITVIGGGSISPPPNELWLITKSSSIVRRINPQGQLIGYMDRRIIGVCTFSTPQTPDDWCFE